MHRRYPLDKYKSCTKHVYLRDMVYLRWLLLPFSLLYAAGVWLRNRLYDWGWLRQTGLAVPVIVVGNLEVGGTGKTPMTEYLIRLLSGRYRVATLSRGYGRKTSGYREVGAGSRADDCGDEPLQFKRKFSAITVAVDEDRVRGAGYLKDAHDVLLLDDAFQHRALKPGFSVLLFDFNRLSRPRFPLPAGDYRDCFGERRRADVLVVTKCPPDLNEAEKKRIKRRLASRRGAANQPILFAQMMYGDPVRVSLPGSTGSGESETREGTFCPSVAGGRVLLVTGIARPTPLVNHLENTLGLRVSHLAFPDHHRFSAEDLERIRRHYIELDGECSIILTTEKDAQRLADPQFTSALGDLPLFYVPIRLGFLASDQEAFDRKILAFVDR